MKLPISICFFTSSKGHFGHKDVYLKTLNHLDKQVPLSIFGSLVAHIKVTPGEEMIGDTMETELKNRGFVVLKTVADWSRGQSHQTAYMEDVIRVSKCPEVIGQPFMLWLEDDSTITCNDTEATALLARWCRMLNDENELTSIRLLRRGDLLSTNIIPPDGLPNRNWFHSEHFNFQPAMLRSRDFYLAALFIERNPQAMAQIQCEMLWRLVLRNFSRSPYLHRVFVPDYAETIHLGTTEYPELIKKLNLT